MSKNGLNNLYNNTVKYRKNSFIKTFIKLVVVGLIVKYLQ